MQKSTTGKFHGVDSLKCLRRWGLFPLNVCCLHDRPPFLDLGLLKGAKRLWGLLIAGRNLHSLVGNALAHGRVGQRIQRIASARLEAAVNGSASIKDLLVRYSDCLMMMVQQSAVYCGPVLRHPAKLMLPAVDLGGQVWLG